MGEIAEAMINGEMCSWCGVYFEQANEFPVLCEDCFQEELDKGETPDTILQKYKLQKTLEDEV